MRLTALEMQGFKSFPDRTRLEFGDGITAVVGPNGSGKSNISDAVRWVLGEQSTKALRSDLMEDVIFNGTQERKPVGFAMVRLTLDNRRGRLEDYGEEVTVARRLYRSGESEYLLDGEQVRLRDVQELFMDTGLGRDGYAIIGQGRISEIVSAKSNDRREIFEEAAGIAKYRYRRNDAQRRLSAAEENLVRLLDILAELEERVEPLRQQSEKAKKFLELAAERKILEISLWVVQLAQLKAIVEEQQKKIHTSKNDYQRLQREGKLLETTLEATQERMGELTAATEDRRRLIRSHESQMAEERSRIAVLKNDIHHNQQSMKRTLEEIAQAAGTTGETQSRLTQEAVALTQAEGVWENAKESLLEVQKKYQQALENEKTIGGTIAALEEQRTALRETISQLELEQATSTTRISENQNRKKMLEENASAHQATVKEYKESLEECATQQNEQQLVLQKMQARYASEQERLQQQREQLETLQEGYQSLAQDIEEKRSRVRILQNLEANLEGYAGSVRYVMRQAENQRLMGVIGPVSSLIQTESDYAVAIETALGGAMQNIVVQDETAAKAAMHSLRQAKAGRATFLPLTSVKGRGYDFSHAETMPGFVGSAASLVAVDNKYQGVIQWLLGRVCIAKTLDDATAIAKANSYRFRIVTLDGQVINAGGSYTGGSTARGVGMLSRKTEIDELIEQGKALRKQANQQLPQIEALQQEIQTQQDKLGQLQEQVDLEKNELTRLGFSYDQLDRSTKAAEEGWKASQRELETLEDMLENLAKGDTDSAVSLTEKQRQLVGLREKLSEKVKEQGAATLVLEELRQSLSDVRLLEYEKRTALEQAKQGVEQTKKLLEDAETQQNNLKVQQTALEESNEEIQKTIVVLERSIEHTLSEISLNNKSIEEFTEKRTQLEQSTTQLRQQEREVSHQREQVSRELVRLEERAQGEQNKYDSIISKLWDEYELTLSQATEQATALEDPQESNKRLTELRNKIRALGTVNVNAIEEYKEVFERYTELSKQLEDVETSKNQLLELIEDLTEEMRVLFMETFEKINHEFSITFRELFGGGKGQLLLTDSEDILEAGIEIHVQPPGKVIKNLSLLSGGEQAFVAIAIYFAILKVKPSPFVLLDEIEAALDDVNVVRYASYLRQMSKDTQCIAITHRRGTMEEADVLYGVTMQEEGVSKLLELDIYEVETKLGMEATD